MNRSLIIAAALVLCNVAHAGDINRCVAPSGELTLTDSPCPADAPAALKPAPGAHTVAVEHVSLRGASSRHDDFVPKQPVSHGLARDVATLKLAHQTMQLLDTSASTMRQQRVASR